jgi:hypothetical protein
MARITGKETAEIHEILVELGRRGVLTFSDGRVTGFSREDALQVLDEEAAAPL